MINQIILSVKYYVYKCKWDDRKNSIVTEEADKREEEMKVQKALETYKCKAMVVLPYVNGVTEKVSRVLKSYNVAAASKPHTTLRNLLVHPKDKRDDHNITDALYNLPCMNCNLEYIGETGRKSGTRLNEHKTEVDKVSKSVFTRANRKESLSTVHKSAVTDHVVERNHVIGWDRARVIGTEQNRYKR